MKGIAFLVIGNVVVAYILYRNRNGPFFAVGRWWKGRPAARYAAVLLSAFVLYQFVLMTIACT